MLCACRAHSSAHGASGTHRWCRHRVRTNTLRACLASAFAFGTPSAREAPSRAGRAHGCATRTTGREVSGCAQLAANGACQPPRVLPSAAGNATRHRVSTSLCERTAGGAQEAVCEPSRRIAPWCAKTARQARVGRNGRTAPPRLALSTSAGASRVLELARRASVAGRRCQTSCSCSSPAWHTARGRCGIVSARLAPSARRCAR